MLEPIEGSRCCALHGADRPAEAIGDLCLGEVLEVAEHEDRSLTPRKCCHHPQQLRACVNCTESLFWTGVAIELQVLVMTGVQFHCKARSPLGARKREVDDDASHIGMRVIHLLDRRPPPCSTQEGFLEQILSLSEVPGEQVRGPQEVGRRLTHEVLEHTPSRRSAEPVHQPPSGTRAGLPLYKAPHDARRFHSQLSFLSGADALLAKSGCSIEAPSDSPKGHGRCTCA